LFYAACNSWHTLIKFLVEHGAIINSKDSYGRTALHWAVFWNRQETVHELLQLGANSNIPDFDGKTSIDIATEREYKEIKEML